MSDDTISQLYKVAWDARLMLQNSKNDGVQLGRFASALLENANAAIDLFHKELRDAESQHDQH